MVDVEILSISIDKSSLKRLEEIQKKLGFKSRSKMLQAAVTSMLKDYEQLESLRGRVEILFVLTYRESERNHVSNILHGFKDTIKTEMHQHGGGVGIDIFNISADASRILKVFRELKKSKCIYSVSYYVLKGPGKTR
jgi:metal-responsive CopG/Arc/MetJ family transcriptional regulator